MKIKCFRNIFVTLYLYFPNIHRILLTNGSAHILFSIYVYFIVVKFYLKVAITKCDIQLCTVHINSLM